MVEEASGPGHSKMFEALDVHFDDGTFERNDREQVVRQDGFYFVDTVGSLQPEMSELRTYSFDKDKNE